MYTKIWVMSVMLVGFLGSVWFSSHAGEGTAPSPEAMRNIGPVLVKAYTFVAVHPNPRPTIFGLTKAMAGSSS